MEVGFRKCLVMMMRGLLCPLSLVWGRRIGQGSSIHTVVRRWRPRTPDVLRASTQQIPTAHSSIPMEHEIAQTICRVILGKTHCPEAPSRYGENNVWSFFCPRSSIIFFSFFLEGKKKPDPTFTPQAGSCTDQLL